nr:biotin/lipoyl-binding protein [Giesbergeria sp.]
ALNGFVIRGISSNIPFQAALLAHPKFVSGDFNTGFIAENYAHGFAAEDVPHEDPLFMVALAAYMNRRYRARASGISGQLSGHEVRVGEQYVVVTLGHEGQNTPHEVSVTDFAVEGALLSSSVLVGGKCYQISSTATLGQIRVQGQCNGKGFTAQIERGANKNPLALRVAHNGTQIEAMVLSPLGARLYQLMPYKAPPDLSKFLLSPMPGLLVDVVVQEGQTVQAGEKLAVIEAMKMENVLFAAQNGVVGKIVAAKGESLAVDQVIIEFV